MLSVNVIQSLQTATSALAICRRTNSSSSRCSLERIRFGDLMANSRVADWRAMSVPSPGGSACIRARRSCSVHGRSKPRPRLLGPAVQYSTLSDSRVRVCFEDASCLPLWINAGAAVV